MTGTSLVSLFQFPMIAGLVSFIFKVRFGFLCVCLLTTCCQSGARIKLLINIIEDIFVLRKLLVQNIKWIHVQRSTEAVKWMCRLERNYRALEIFHRGAAFSAVSILAWLNLSLYAFSRFWRLIGKRSKKHRAPAPRHSSVYMSLSPLNVYLGSEWPYPSF